MARPLGGGEKPLDWVGSSKKDFLTFPARVKDEMGVALGVAQFGGKHPSAKPWKGQGPGVLEIVEDHSGNAYSIIHRPSSGKSSICLHAFQKNSPKTALTDIELVEGRPAGLRGSLCQVEALTAPARPRETIIRGTGNVFADLGYADAEERQTKLRLAHAINVIIASKRLSASGCGRAPGRRTAENLGPRPLQT